MARGMQICIGLGQQPTALRSTMSVRRVNAAGSVDSDSLLQPAEVDAPGSRRACFVTRTVNCHLLGVSPQLRRSSPTLVLFDRDSTLIEDPPDRVRKPSDVRLMPGAARALSAAIQRGASVGIVTNQSAVARGLVDGVSLGGIMEEMARLLWSDALGGPLFQFWTACPHLPNDGCACRKPRPGMVETAIGLHDAVDRLIMFGDSASDIEAARQVGGVGHLIQPGDLDRAIRILENL